MNQVSLLLIIFISENHLRKKLKILKSLNVSFLSIRSSVLIGLVGILVI